MHPEAHDGLDRMLAAAGIDFEQSYSCYDFGGRDINGSIRNLLPAAGWCGIDIVPGPAVTFVRDLTREPINLAVVDIIACTEVFEHVQNWPAVVANAAHCLSAGGPELFFVTCASTGRRPHGASGEMDPPPGEWYANVPPELLRQALEWHFHEVHVEYQANPGDAYAWAQGVRR